jgi:hypothetical protein
MISSYLISFSNFRLILSIFSLREFWASVVAMLSRSDSLNYQNWYFVETLPFFYVFLVFFEDVGVDDALFSSVVYLLFEFFGFAEEKVFKVFHVLDLHLKFLKCFLALDFLFVGKEGR